MDRSRGGNDRGIRAWAVLAALAALISAPAHAAPSAEADFNKVSQILGVQKTWAPQLKIVLPGRPPIIQTPTWSLDDFFVTGGGCSLVYHFVRKNGAVVLEDKEVRPPFDQPQRVYTISLADVYKRSFVSSGITPLSVKSMPDYIAIYMERASGGSNYFFARNVGDAQKVAGLLRHAIDTCSGKS